MWLDENQVGCSDLRPIDLKSYFLLIMQTLLGTSTEQIHILSNGLVPKSRLDSRNFVERILKERSVYGMEQKLSYPVWRAG